MSRKFEYAIVQLADRNRQERLNAALAIFTDQGLDLRVPRRLDKLHALSSALNVEDVRASLGHLVNFDQIVRDQGRLTVESRIQSLAALTSLEFSGRSFFVAPTSAAYEDWADRLLKLLVEPEPKQARHVRKRTNLLAVVKSAFRAERVLAKPGEDLSQHRLVSNVVISEGLLADFVLKNGVMHVIETVDASNEEFSVKKVITDIAVSALTLEQARMKFGEKSTQAKIVYDASAAVERIAMPSLEAAARQGAELFNWASFDDRNRLLSDVTKLADPYDLKRSKYNGINASTQHRFNLN